MILNVHNERRKIMKESHSKGGDLYRAACEQLANWDDDDIKLRDIRDDLAVLYRTVVQLCKKCVYEFPLPTPEQEVLESQALADVRQELRDRQRTNRALNKRLQAIQRQFDLVDNKTNFTVVELAILEILKTDSAQ